MAKLSNSNDSAPTQSSMSYKDAAIVSLILAIGAYFIGFLAGFGYSDLTNWGEFCFDSIKFIGAIFFTDFIALTGLSKLAK